MPALWTFSVSNDLRACSSALFVMAERTPVVKKYRDALENVIGATMEFLAQVPPRNPDHDPALSSPTQTDVALVRTPQQTHCDLPGKSTSFSPGFKGAAQESFVRGSAKTVQAGASSPTLKDAHTDPAGYVPESYTGPALAGRWEGRHGELGQMDAEWLLSLCEGDGFNLQMLNEMMRFEPSLGA